MVRRFRVLAPIALALPTLACGEGRTPVEPPPPSVPASVALAPGEIELGRGAVARFDASVRDSTGRPIDAAVEWSSSDTTVVVVSAEGTATARALGVAWVRGRSGAASDSARVRVAGCPTPFKADDPLVGEEIGNPAAVGPDSLVSLLRRVNGRAYVSFREATDPTGAPASESTFIEAVGDLIYGHEGIGVCRRVGGTATAEFVLVLDHLDAELVETILRHPNVLVLAPHLPGCPPGGCAPAELLEVDPPETDLGMGGEARFTAIGLDRAGIPRAAAPEVSWVSSDPTVVSVSSRGEVRGLAHGEAWIRVTDVDGISDSARVSVVPCPSPHKPDAPMFRVPFGDPGSLTADSLATVLRRFNGRAAIGFKEADEEAGYVEGRGRIVTDGTIARTIEELRALGLHLCVPLESVGAADFGIPPRDLTGALVERLRAHPNVWYLEPSGYGCILERCWLLFDRGGTTPAVSPGSPPGSAGPAARRPTRGGRSGASPRRERAGSS